MSDRDPNSPSNVLSFPSQNFQPSVEMIPFAGGTIEALKSQGSGWLRVRAACEGMGIDHKSQRRRLEQAPWATGAIMTPVGTATDGKQREMFCLRIDRVAMWLATIETSRIADLAVRAKIELWQCEAADALDRWFRGAAFVRPAEVTHSPVDNFGRLEEWTRMQRHIAIAGEALNILKDDSAGMKRELAAQREYIETLDAQLHRNMPTPEERAAAAKAIQEACECRVSEREQLMLTHIALEGPATSSTRIGAAARVSSSLALVILKKLNERALVDIEQRDPHNGNLKNYSVILEGLQGHAPDCDITARRALDKMKEVTRDAAVHVVPPNIPHIPVPQAQPQLGLQEVETPLGMSEREELMKTVRSICYHNGLDYHDFMSKLYVRLKFEGMDCRKTKKITRIDYMERHGWCGRAKQIAEKMPIHEIRQAQNVGHA